jgi:hypothetical protein
MMTETPRATTVGTYSHERRSAIGFSRTPCRGRLELELTRATNGIERLVQAYQ